MHLSRCTCYFEVGISSLILTQCLQIRDETCRGFIVLIVSLFFFFITEVYGKGNRMKRLIVVTVWHYNTECENVTLYKYSIVAHLNKEQSLMLHDVLKTRIHKAKTDVCQSWSSNIGLTSNLRILTSSNSQRATKLLKCTNCNSIIRSPSSINWLKVF